MTGGQAAVVLATAAVFVDGRRTGSAVLGDPRHLVTARHVLQRRDPDTGATVLADQVEVEFPGRQPGGQGIRTPASRLGLGPAGAGVDVAVLDLGRDPPSGLPAPVQVWPAARPPGRVQVFGYPLAEGSLKGVWRQFTVAGPAAAGTVQLDWADDVGTFPGHSGGPVIDADGHALVGILVEGSERGRFDRFLPVTLITQAWPQLPRPWLITGADQGEARSHFTRRARGQRSAARGGDLFRGRQVALDRIRGWLTAREPPGQPLVVTGQPGAGKSAVLARAALSVEAQHGGLGLAFHARAVTIGDFLTALANLTGVDTPTSIGELVTSFADLPEQPATPVVLDSLDEAASHLDRRQITEALAELAALRGLRVAVATRPLAAGDPYAPGGLLPMLGVTSCDDPSLIDLDTDTYFDLDGLRQFAAALLAQKKMDSPGPPGAAWTQYRARRAVCNRLATVIADRAGRNFLVAAMAAVPLSTAPQMIDPAATGFDPADIPSGVGEALSKYLDRLPEHRRERDRGLLTALAYARGAGLDDPAWLAFAAALGHGSVVTDLDVLRHSPAADYLLQTTTTERGDRPVTRLFHQALTDELLAGRHQPGDEDALLDMLLGQAARTGWQARYLRDHVADHAAAADRLDQLLEDPHYLLSVDPARLVPHLDAARSAPARATATVYRQNAHRLAALDRPARASQLELTAHRLGFRDLAARIASAAPDRPWRTRWSHGRRAADHQVLTGHTGVYAVAVGELPDGTPLIVAGGWDGTVRIWRLADGTPVGNPLTGHTGPVEAVAVGVLQNGTPVIVSGGNDGTVRVWRLADGTPVGNPLSGHTGPVTVMAVGALRDGTPVIASGGNDSMVRVWRLADGTPVGHPLSGHTDSVTAVAVGALRDGTPVIVSGGNDSMVRVWRLADGTPVGNPLSRHIGAVTAVAVGALRDGTPVIVSSGNDSMVRVWRLADGISVGEPLRATTDSVTAVAVGALRDGTPVIVSSGNDGTVRVWRLADGTPVGDPLSGHTATVTAVAAGRLRDGTPVIVSGSEDRTVRVWWLADGTPVGDPLSGHTATVTAVAAGRLRDGTPVIVSGDGDGAVRVWRLARRPLGLGPRVVARPVGEPLTGTGPVEAVAVGALRDGTPVIVSSGWDTKVWRLARRPLGLGPRVVARPVGEPLTGDMVLEARPDGTPVFISSGHTGPVNVMAVGALRDGTPVIVSSGNDGWVWVWRLADRTPVGEPFTGHTGDVNAVAVGALPDGTPVIVSGGRDGTIRVWRLPDGTPVAHPLDLSESVEGIAFHGNIIVTAVGWDIAVHQPVVP